jgi:hypothetical protein
MLLKRLPPLPIEPDPVIATIELRDVDYMYFLEQERPVQVPASGHVVRILVEAMSEQTVILNTLRAVAPPKAS